MSPEVVLGVMELTATKAKIPKYSGLTELIYYAKPYKMKFFAAFFILMLATGIEMLSPWLMKIIIDEHIAPGRNNIIDLTFIGSGLFATYLASSIFHYIQNLCFQKYALKVVHDIRKKLFTHVLSLPVNYFDSEPTGSLVSRITNDTEVLSRVFVDVLPAILQAFLRVFGIFIAMALLDFHLMLMSLLLIPIMLLAIHYYQKKSHPLIHGVRSELANINTRINETLGNMRIVQAMGQEAHLQKQFNKDNDRWSELKKKNINIDSLLLMPFTNLLNVVALAIVVSWFSYRASFSLFEVGTLYAFINYLGRFFEPFKQITMQMSSLQLSLVAGERILQVLNEKREKVSLVPKDNGFKVTVVDKGSLEFQNVTFSYDGKNTALDDVSFSVDPGQFVAIVGHSGSGKSSVINLLMRFYQHGSGQILIDHQSINRFEENTLRKSIGLVFRNLIFLMVL